MRLSRSPRQPAVWTGRQRRPAQRGSRAHLRQGPVAPNLGRALQGPRLVRRRHPRPRRTRPNGHDVPACPRFPQEGEGAQGRRFRPQQGRSRPDLGHCAFSAPPTSASFPFSFFSSIPHPLSFPPHHFSSQGLLRAPPSGALQTRRSGLLQKWESKPPSHLFPPAAPVLGSRRTTKPGLRLGGRVREPESWMRPAR